MNSSVLRTTALVMGTLFFISTNAQEEGQRKRKGPPPPDKVIDRLDTSKDGLISLDEAKQAKRKKLAEQFNQIDTGADGFIDLNELTAFHEKLKSQKRKKKDDLPQNETE